jgi:putative pyrroloquinoline-quinone binding quinoprotein
MFMMNHQIKKKAFSLILVITFITCNIILFPPSFKAENSIINDDDSFWQVNQFVLNELSDWEIDNTIDIANGNIQLKESEDIYNRTYDFSQADHTVYFHPVFNFWQFIPPYLHHYHDPIQDPWTLSMIKHDLSDYGSSEGVVPKVLKTESDKIRQLVHYFKFKLSDDKESINKIDIEWLGNASNDLKIKMYCWFPLVEQFSSIGYWDHVASRRSNSSYIWITKTISNEIPVVDGYVNICLVAVPDFEMTTSLSSDYISIKIYSEEANNYFPNGYIISEPISKTDENATWEWFSWEHSNKNNPNIKYQILYENETGSYVPVQNEYVANNEDGFTVHTYDTPHKSLHNIPQNYSKLKIKAVLYSSSDEGTPIIKMLGVTWQDSKDIWKDLMQSSPPLRINQEESQNVLYTDEKIKINPLLNNWPMFGYNKENTRSSLSEAPDEFKTSWFYQANPNSYYERVGGRYLNPILGSEYLYIPTSDGRQIYSFEPIKDSPYEPARYIKKITIPDNYKINNTPAIYIKQGQRDIIIAATSNDYNSKINDNWENKVYAFYGDLLGNSPWSEPFSFKDINSADPNICYSASPVISNDIVYLSSWSGSILGSGNDYIIALDIDTGNHIWVKELPAGSYSSPAVSDNTVFVGCKNPNGPSILAYDKTTGRHKWNVSIGAIGHASLLLHEDRLIAITNKNLNSIEIFALDTNNKGAVLWNRTISMIVNPLLSLVDNSPSLYNNVLYIATADGKIHALKLSDGAYYENWVQNPKPITPLSSLLSSPSCADDKVFISTGKGMYALAALSGEELWDPVTQVISTSPIIGDGYLYYANDNGNLYSLGESEVTSDIEGYVVSTPIYLPSPQDVYIWDVLTINATSIDNHISYSILNKNGQVLEDNIKSSSISLQFLNQLSTGKPDTIILRADLQSEDSTVDVSIYDWSIKFGINASSRPIYSNFKKDIDIPMTCQIDVQDSISGLNNSTASFNLQYYESDIFKEKSGDIIPDFANGSKNKETLFVNLSSLEYLTINSSTMNIRSNISDLQIMFSIENINGTKGISDWYNIISPRDKEKPLFYLQDFTPTLKTTDPPSLYISTLTPTFSIMAKDVGNEDNITGINIDSAEFDLRYTDEVGTQTETFTASCTGSNGTQNKVKLTADIAALNFTYNVTELSRIRFRISDMASNTNTTDWITINYDDIPPVSSISNSEDIPTFANTSPINIIIEASDTLSGIQDVSLYYRKVGNTQWSLFDSPKTSEPYDWDFIIGNSAGGEYELISIAIDKAGNEESFSSSPEVVFTYDPNPPPKPIFASSYEFTNANAKEDEIPIFSDVTFEDDYRLYSVEYRMNFDGTNQWTKINDQAINEEIYTPHWNITSSQWNQIEEDTNYYIFFKVTDALGNVYETQSNSQAMIIIKNFHNVSRYKPDLSDFDSWQWNNEYIIRVQVNDSDLISDMRLWYSHSDNDSSEYTWKQYGENLSNSNFEWKFIPEDGDGYYSFYIEVLDAQGLKYTSEIQTIHISLFPMMELIIFCVLVVILFFVTILIFTQIRKSKKKI